MRTQRSRAAEVERLSQRADDRPRLRPCGRAATASSRSRIRPSAGSVSALAIIRSLPPGTKCRERRRPGHARGPLAHHRLPPRAHDERRRAGSCRGARRSRCPTAGATSTRAGPRPPSPRRSCRRGTRASGNSTFSKPRLPTVVPERGLADRQADGDAEREQAVDERLAELRLGRGVEVDVQRLRVHGEAGEEDVVRLGDGPPGLVLEACARPAAPRSTCPPWAASSTATVPVRGP